MHLDYNPKTDRFIVRVPRSEATLVQSLMNEHGLMFSEASTASTAILFPDGPYGAVPFAEHGTPQALAQLAPILRSIEQSWKAESSARIRCPADRELWPFQKADIEYALARKHCLVGDQPGLGKSPTAVAFANEIRAKRVLVVCPASIRLQWVKRIREWTTIPWPYIIHPILHSRHGVHPDAQWTVVSYELASTPAIGAALARQRFDLLILDEAHYLKTIDSRRSRAVWGGGEGRSFEALAGRAERILALTGTPLPNRPREAYTLARGLCSDAIDWASEDSFRQRFNPSRRIEYLDARTGQTKVRIDERSGRHAELQARLRANFMVRHEKHGPRGVMGQLKLPIYDLIQLEKTKAVKQALDAESLLDIDPEYLKGADAAALGHMATVRKLMGLALAPQIADYVDDLIDGGEEKLTIFAWHVEVLNILEHAWRKHGVVRIDGSTSLNQRERRIHGFLTNPACKIILGNMLAMGTGTDGLQEVCSHGLIAEPDWVPGNNQQAFDRLDRGGQRQQVHADIFVAPGSFAERILASSLKKLGTTHKALDRRGWK